MESELAKPLVEWVKQWRKERGLTQEQFAEIAGMDPKHYQHIESQRKVDFRMSTLEKLAKGCGLPPAELLRFQEMSTAVSDTEQARYLRSPKRRKPKK